MSFIQALVNIFSDKRIDQLNEILPDSATHIIHLYAWAAKHRPDGLLNDLSINDICRAANIDPNPDWFFKARELGFILTEKQSYKLPETIAATPIESSTYKIVSESCRFSLDTRVEPETNTYARALQDNSERSEELLRLDSQNNVITPTIRYSCDSTIVGLDCSAVLTPPGISQSDFRSLNCPQISLTLPDQDTKATEQDVVPMPSARHRAGERWAASASPTRDPCLGDPTIEFSSGQWSNLPNVHHGTRDKVINCEGVREPKKNEAEQLDREIWFDTLHGFNEYLRLIGRTPVVGRFSPRVDILLPISKSEITKALDAAKKLNKNVTYIVLDAIDVLERTRSKIQPKERIPEVPKRTPREEYEDEEAASIATDGASDGTYEENAWMASKTLAELDRELEMPELLKTRVMAIIAARRQAKSLSDLRWRRYFIEPGALAPVTPGTPEAIRQNQVFIQSLLPGSITQN